MPNACCRFWASDSHALHLPSIPTRRAPSTSVQRGYRVRDIRKRMGLPSTPWPDPCLGTVSERYGPASDVEERVCPPGRANLWRATLLIGQNSRYLEVWNVEMPRIQGTCLRKACTGQKSALQISGRMTLWGFIISDNQKSEILAFWVFERLKLHYLTAQIHAQQPLDELGQILVCSFILQLAVGHLLRVFA